MDAREGECMKETDDLPTDEWFEMMDARLTKLERIIARLEREKKLREERAQLKR